MRAGWAGIGVGIRVDWVVYGCFGGMGRFGVLLSPWLDLAEFLTHVRLYSCPCYLQE